MSIPYWAVGDLHKKGDVYFSQFTPLSIRHLQLQSPAFRRSRGRREWKPSRVPLPTPRHRTLRSPWRSRCAAPPPPPLGVPSCPPPPRYRRRGSRGGRQPPAGATTTTATASDSARTTTTSPSSSARRTSRMGVSAVSLATTACDVYWYFGRILLGHAI